MIQDCVSKFGYYKFCRRVEENKIEQKHHEGDRAWYLKRIFSGKTMWPNKVSNIK